MGQAHAYSSDINFELKSGDVYSEVGKLTQTIIIWLAGLADNFSAKVMPYDAIMKTSYRFLCTYIVVNHILEPVLSNYKITMLRLQLMMICAAPYMGCQQAKGVTISGTPFV